MDLRRQSKLVDAEKLELLPILIIGGGSIGSYTTLALTKMGAKKIKVIDFDKLESQNIPNQFYKVKDVGKYKVEALEVNIQELTGTMIRTKVGKFEDKDINFAKDGIVIAATDNMAARKQLFEVLVKTKVSKRYIDARMASLSIEIFNIDPTKKKDQDFYKRKLFDEKDAVHIPCTAKGIVFPVMTCASIVSNAVLNHVMGHFQQRRFIMDYSKDMFLTEE